MKLFEFVTWMFTEDEDESRDHIEKGVVQVEGEVILDPLYEIKPRDFVRFWDQGCSWSGETPVGPLPRKERRLEKLERLRKRAKTFREIISSSDPNRGSFEVSRCNLVELFELLNELEWTLEGYKMLVEEIKWRVENRSTSENP